MTAQRLRAMARELASRVVDAMYDDPFWMARFGARGRVRSEEDLVYHVEYLAEAVDAEDPQVMARYADWLRGVLTSRGMCTRHLEESFERLQQAIPVEMAALVAAPLEAARAALRYPAGAAREVQEASPSIVMALASPSGDGDGPPRFDARTLERELSYLADALARGDSSEGPNHFAEKEAARVARFLSEQLRGLSPEAAARARAVLGR